MNRARMLTLLFVGVSIVLLLCCGLGAAAVHQGVVAPPNIKLEFGGMLLVSNISTSPDCMRLLVPGCLSAQRSQVVWTYTLWLLRQRNPGSWVRPQITRLFSVQIKH